MNARKYKHSQARACYAVQNKAAHPLVAHVYDRSERSVDKNL